ncbi:MAG: TIGR02680 family protein [Pseudonocardia sp.]
MSASTIERPHDLPIPTRERWQPLRAGLVDLFYYDAEEFRFHDGRLLLRGNNGTGKSKVLALLLPFLLDGDLSPHRVEPDADAKKRMEWNLLLGGEHPHPERLGYTWLEFGRLGEHGPEFRTLGCGLKAVAGRGIAKHWYLLTDQRVGAELHLLDATRHALTRERLAETVAGRGAVYDRARDYRRAVDEALFGLGEQRYGALVDLLVQLRQPQLSKKPSERALSDALTESLPPLDQAVVADVAEAFRSLEEDRDELTAMAEAHDCARGFLAHYRRYASIATRRRAERPRRAEGTYRTARDTLATAEQAQADADAAVSAARAELGSFAERAETLRSQDAALRASPEMRSAEELDRRAAETRRRETEAERAATDRQRASAQLDERRRRLSGATDDAEAAANDLAARRRDGLEAAAAARVGAHPHEVDAGFDSTAAQSQRWSTLRDRAADLVARQERAVRHVGGLLDADADAARQLATAARELDQLDAAGQALAERRFEALSAVEAHGKALVGAVRAHLEEAVELAVPDPESVLAELAVWVSTLDGPDPARSAIDATGRAAGSALAHLAAGSAREAAAAQARAAELAEEIRRLESGEHSEPPVPHTRRPEARAGRPGAPFWRLVDFAETVPDAERAGLEAALEASGILDAWLDPAGVLLDVDGDLLLAPETHRRADEPASDSHRAHRSLASVLVAASDPADDLAAAVSAAAVDSALASIGWGEQPGSWVDGTGRFRLGVVTGSWRKPAAEYLGRGAREASRRARLAQRRAEADKLAIEQARIRADQDRLAQRQRTLHAELDGVPRDTALRESHAMITALAAEQARLAGRRGEAEAALGRARTSAEAAAEALRAGAGDLDLPADRGGLAEVREALVGYREVLAGLWPAAQSLDRARSTLAEATADRDLALDQLTTAAERAADADRAARASAEEYRTLRDTVGAAVQELQARLDAVSAERDANERAQRTARSRQDAAILALGQAQGEHRAAVDGLARAAEERAAAARSLSRFAATGLIAVALPQLELPSPDATWAPEPTVRLARQIDQELESVPVDDAAADRAVRRVTEELKTLTDTLARQGNRASAQLLEDGIVVEVVFRGRPATVPELAEALGTEVADRTRLLDEREREILENHLVNEVASTLQELIGEAERQVRLMNSELDERPTSTGMRLRLEWRPREDGPPGLAEARRRLLRQSSDAWSADDRAAVGGFLQDRIADIRARDETGTWLGHLTAALDYRSWHRFVIERHQNGQWRPATGPASGGERVLAASVPLFAAASSHYASASNPHAPRLVTLDEAFAGVDDNARAKYLGLLAAFDLDVVMTSEREWGCYPEVPGLAIAQLARTDGVAAVLVTNWRWDGTVRTRQPRPSALPAPPRSGADPPATDEEGLF